MILKKQIFSQNIGFVEEDSRCGKNSKKIKHPKLNKARLYTNMRDSHPARLQANEFEFIKTLPISSVRKPLLEVLAHPDILSSSRSCCLSDKN